MPFKSVPSKSEVLLVSQIFSFEWRDSRELSAHKVESENSPQISDVSFNIQCLLKVLQGHLIVSRDQRSLLHLKYLYSSNLWIIEREFFGSFKIRVLVWNDWTFQMNIIFHLSYCTRKIHYCWDLSFHNKEILYSPGFSIQNYQFHLWMAMLIASKYLSGMRRRPSVLWVRR